MTLQRRSAASSTASVRRYLSEADEKEVLRVLRDQLRHQRRVTSDDVRLVVRAVASQGGRVALPPDFPSSRWVLEFKRVHGFVQFNSFAFAASGGGKAAFGLPGRLEHEPPLRSATPAAAAAIEPNASRDSRQNSLRNTRSSSSSSSVAQVTGSSLGSGNSSDDEREKEPSEDSRSLATEIVPTSAVGGVLSAAVGLRERVGVNNETQRQVRLQNSFSQRHRQFLQQQQRRAMVVDERRRTREAEEQEEMQSNSGSDNETTTGPSNSLEDVGRSGVARNIRSILPPHIRHSVSNNGSVTDDMQDSASNASSPANDKRGYKLSHTVPAETWEKAIAAVEQQGMSLRAAAKRYGVHFAALHRRVKKRAQGGQSKGSNGYFHPSDEAGIMRVVVARAELGVLMTFDELMRLVEAAALRKLPNLSVEGARNLLTRFQSRNEQSVRHIIDDWPPPRPAVNATALEGQQRQPYLEHPGFNYGTTDTGGISTAAAAVAAATPKSLFVLPTRLRVDMRVANAYGDESRKSTVRLSDTMKAMEIGTTSSSPYVRCATFSETERSHNVCIEEGGLNSV